MPSTGERFLVDRGDYFALILLLACGIQRAGAAGAEIRQPLVPPRSFQVMARGGALDRAPANTKAAIERCIADQFEWVVLRIGRTKDGHHVLAEPSPLTDPAQGGKSLAERTLAELKQLDAGSWFAKRFARSSWLSLAECLKLAQNKINLCLDLVDVEPSSLAQEIRTAGMSRQVMLLVGRDARSTFGAPDDPLPIALRAPTNVAVEAILPAIANLAAIEVDASQITAPATRALHDRGLKIMARFGADEDHAESWDRALSCGVDILQSAQCENIVAHVLAAKLRSRTCRLTCHRGASAYAPENTLPAFAKAAQLHADFVEFDVRPSRDGVYFLLHDSKLDRTTDARGPIRDMTAAELGRLDVGGWFARRYAGTRMPTLDEFLAQAPLRMELYFDAKDIQPEDLVRSLAAHQLVERTVVYQGADYLRKLARIDAHVRTMPPARSIADVASLLSDASFKPYAVDSAWRALSKEYIDRCHAAGIRVFSDAPPGTSVQAMVQAIRWGLDVIQTDEPMRYWRAVELAAD